MEFQSESDWFRQSWTRTRVVKRVLSFEEKSDLYSIRNFSISRLEKRKMPLARERYLPGILSLWQYMRDTASFLQIPLDISKIWLLNYFDFVVYLSVDHFPFSFDASSRVKMPSTSIRRLLQTYNSSISRPFWTYLLTFLTYWST